MNSLDNYLCLICAKGNSKGLKKKNIKKIEGETLLEIAFKKAKKNNFNFFCLSTEDNNIIKIAKKFEFKS